MVQYSISTKVSENQREWCFLYASSFPDGRVGVKDWVMDGTQLSTFKIRVTYLYRPDVSEKAGTALFSGIRHIMNESSLSN